MYQKNIYHLCNRREHKKHTEVFSNNVRKISLNTGVAKMRQRLFTHLHISKHHEKENRDGMQNVTKYSIVVQMYKTILIKEMGEKCQTELLPK